LNSDIFFIALDHAFPEIETYEQTDEHTTTGEN